MYIFVRQDISFAQQAVQSCHAAIEASSAFSFGALTDHPSVIILGIRDERRLHNVRSYLLDQGIPHVTFTEPDLDGELTAVATEPVYGERRSLFKRFQLLRPKGGHE